MAHEDPLMCYVQAILSLIRKKAGVSGLCDVAGREDEIYAPALKGIIGVEKGSPSTLT